MDFGEQGNQISSKSRSPERDAINGSNHMLAMYTKTDWKLNRELNQWR